MTKQVSDVVLIGIFLECSYASAQPIPLNPREAPASLFPLLTRVSFQRTSVYEVAFLNLGPEPPDS